MSARNRKRSQARKRVQLELWGMAYSVAVTNILIPDLTTYQKEGSFVEFTKNHIQKSIDRIKSGSLDAVIKSVLS